MKLGKSDLLDALRLRYDHYSATSIFEATLARASLPDQDAYDENQVAAFRAALARVGDRLQNVEVRIAALLAEPTHVEPVKPTAAPGIYEVEATPPIETTI